MESKELLQFNEKNFTRLPSDFERNNILTTQYHFIDCVIVNNTATKGGGGIIFTTVSNLTPLFGPTITIHNNTAEYGGAILFSDYPNPITVLHGADFQNK